MSSMIEKFDNLNPDFPSREVKQMASLNLPLCLLLLSYFPYLLISIVVVSSSFHHTLGHATEEGRKRYEGAGAGHRVLLSFKETPAGSNVTFECSPSGPCVPCLYSEKNDEKYRCSETGYRIPLKCVENDGKSKASRSIKSKNSRSVLESAHNKVKPHVSHDGEDYPTPVNHRRLLDDSATSEGHQSQAYITYRSCIPPANEEKLSVLGFEGIMLCLLLISGSVVYFRRKQTAAMSGVGAARIQTNSRF